ncbi:hypothetical protein [Microterricola viridarii]|uniref:Uncharacterized protein n=1 Tax=Microterricola viridarii TaxID=412690 RepID=A0A1H1Y9F9_9MICO|nr:hypothetical protein [Microterricola viridarii]SDT18032.1 hypothetical protein SAMN04489834_3013 [Microterricola viridarii]
MSPLLIIIVVIAVLMLFAGSLIDAIGWMFWLGVVLLVAVWLDWLLRARAARRDNHR